MATWCLFCAQRGLDAIAAFTVEGDPACVHCAPVEAKAAGCEPEPLAVRPEPPARSIGGELVRMSPHAVMGAELLSPQREKRPMVFQSGAGRYRPRQRVAPACRVTPAQREAIRGYPDGTPFTLIAKETGASYDQVRVLRKAAGFGGGRLGLGSEIGRARAQALNRARGEATWKLVEPHIGKMHDRDVARLTGVTASRVAQIRWSRGIPAFGRAADGLARRTVAIGEATWKRVERYIGKMTDAEAGRRAGVTKSRVKQIREQRGIPAFSAPARRGDDDGAQ